MPDTENRLFLASSRESSIDARLDVLIAKIMTGRASSRDKAEYQELLASRIRLMRPKNSYRSTLVRGLSARRKYA